jgi:hypothetical protein
MSVAHPEKFSSPAVLEWAHKHRRDAFAATRDQDAFGKFAAYGLEADAHHKNAAEAQSHVLLLAAAWRDCVCRGPCLADHLQETDTVSLRLL